MDDGARFWVAEFQTGHTRSVSYGSTPEGALIALVELWIERHCATTKADPDLPWELREDILIGRASLGKGFMLGHHDRDWLEEIVNASDERLSGTWQSLAARYGIAQPPPPGPR